jgi:hypothetical protein
MIRQRILDQASPIFPFSCSQPMIDNTEVESFRTAESSRILHMEFSSQTKQHTENVCNYLNENKVASPAVMYFGFGNHDVRFNSIQAMLQTFFAQSIHNLPLQFRDYYTLNTIGTFEHLDAWTVEDLYRHWECLRVQNRKFTYISNNAPCFTHCFIQASVKPCMS